MRRRIPWRDNTGAERIVLAITIVLLIARFLLIDWNRAEFTDSIIQLRLFENRNGYFPPLYPAMARLLSLITRDPVQAGRVLSIFAISLMVPLVWHLGKAVGGGKSGLWAGLLFAVSPVPWRWSLHAMGDTVFACLFLLAFSCCVLAIQRGDGSGTERMGRYGFWGVFLAGIATLTRYQGFLLLPFAAMAWWLTTLRRDRRALLLAAAIPWLGVGLWMAGWGFVHGGQFAERTAGSFTGTFFVYGIFAVSFVRFAPLAFGVILCALALFASLAILLRRGKERPFVLLVLALSLVWLVVHAAFQSFQYRYFLPIVPLLCILAGNGLGRLEALSKSRIVGLIVGLVAVGELGFSTVRVLQGTRNTFADFPEAGRYLSTLPPDTPIYSNEMWNPGFLCPKIRYWSRRDVKFAALRPGPGGEPAIVRGRLDENGQWVLSGLPQDETAVFCWHNVYGPGMGAVVQGLERRPGVRVLYRTREYENLPRLPDIMVDPPVTSQPRAMLYRERRQRYQTVILQVGPGVSGRKTGPE